MNKFKLLILFLIISCLSSCKFELHKHSFEKAYVISGGYHVLVCECGHRSENEAHYGGTATCQKLAKCSICNYRYGNLLEHEYTILKYNEEGHWLECECGQKDEIEAHYGGSVTCQSLAKCSKCSSEYGQLLEHEYINKVYDEESHWLECSCKDFLEKEEHQFEEGIITLDPTDKTEGVKSYSCLNCDYVKEERLPMINGSEVSTYPHLSNADIVYYEGNIYTYGGNASGRTNSIYCFNINTSKLYELDVKLKSESTSHRVVLVGSKVYIFGGLTNSGRLQTILVHDLEKQTLEELDTKIPFGANCFQAGYYEEKVYLIGGSTSNGNSNKIYQFDINTQTFTELSVTIPSVVFKGAWCSVGKYAYVIGGTNGKRLTSIYRFDMETHEVKTMNAVLPYNISQSRAAYDGEGNIYIYGGTNESNQLVDYIFKYNIEEDLCVVADYKFPQVLANTCVVKTEKGIYILGGDNAYTNMIYKHVNDEIITVWNSIAVE